MFCWAGVGLFLVLWLGLSGGAKAQRPAPNTPDTFTFLHVAQARIGEETAAGRLRALIQQATTEQTMPRFVIATGNLTQRGTTEELEQFKSVMNGWKDAGLSAWYAVPGSHEVRWSAEAKEGFARTIGKLYQSFEQGGVHFILLDSTVAQQSWGHLDKAQLDWLEKDLGRVRGDTPIFVFLYHRISQEAPSTRPLDNEYDLWPLLMARNVVAVFMGQTQDDLLTNINGVTLVGARGLNNGAYHRVTVTPLTVTIERVTSNKPNKPALVARVPLRRTGRSRLLATWDDAQIAFLARRHIKAELQPRSLTDNPDQETGEYRLNDGPWKPLTKDSRDAWRDMFFTKTIPIGIHTATVRVVTTGNALLQRELIFEVERGFDEPTRKWAVNLDGPIQSTPILYESFVIVSALDGKVYALNRENGRRRWVFPTRGTFLASPVREGETIYLGGTDGFFYALDAKTGRQRWRYEAGSPIQATAAVAQGVVCFGINGKIIGLDAHKGTPLWSVPTEGHFQSRAATDGATFYLGGWDNAVYALDAQTGTLRWKATLEAGDRRNSPAAASPSVDNGRLFISTLGQRLYALDTRNGATLWSVQAPPDGDPFGRSTAVPFGPSLYVAGSGKNGDVYALSVTDGALIWRVSTGQAIYDSYPTLTEEGKSFAIMGFRGRVSVLETQRGKTLWRYELGPGNIFSAPAYDGTNVYTVTMANDVQSLTAPGTQPPLRRKSR
jgi:outer membrane protein assembly factor BamB